MAPALSQISRAGRVSCSELLRAAQGPQPRAGGLPNLAHSTRTTRNKELIKTSQHLNILNRIWSHNINPSTLVTSFFSVKKMVNFIYDGDY